MHWRGWSGGNIRRSRQLALPYSGENHTQKEQQQQQQKQVSTNGRTEHKIARAIILAQLAANVLAEPLFVSYLQVAWVETRSGRGCQKNKVNEKMGTC